MKYPRFSAAILALAAASFTHADVTLPAIFSDHLVLQRETSVPVWGWADPGEEVTISVAGQTQSIRAAADGSWRVKFSGLRSAAPTTLTVKGKNTLTISDVLIGEVWLGSGQSNMAWTVSRSNDAAAEQAAANFPQIRLFKEESTAADAPQRLGKGKWVLCSPETVGSSSATLYFFGREIHRALGVPVGLVNSSVGGTPIESWIDEAAQRSTPALHGSLPAPEPEKATGGKDRKTQTAKQKAAALAAERKGGPGDLFNGKIAPLIPYAIRGALWYQGEANTMPAKTQYYEAQLKLLITDWRARWGYEFPFAWAQLPNFLGAGRDWPPVREAMLKTLALPKTGMGINIDIGEEKDIHPKNKQEVGRRLSLWALGTVYGQKVPATSGPLPAGHDVRGKEIVVRFSHADGGLVAKDGGLKSFVIAGADKQWKPAQARIVGDTVVVSSPEVAAPVAVRYGWENFPACNLYNGAGLPATPFRTDTW